MSKKTETIYIIIGVVLLIAVFFVSADNNKRKHITSYTEGYELGYKLGLDSGVNIYMNVFDSMMYVKYKEDSASLIKMLRADKINSRKQ